MKSSQLALAGLALPMLLSSLGTSIANVALPTLARTFGAPFREVQWVVIAYLLAVTAASVGAGRLGDRLGRRRMLLAGIVIFAAGAGASGVAPALWPLVAARAAQGLGAALMMALPVAFVRDTVSPERTGRAMGLLGSTSAIGTAIGPALGGGLIELLGWRAMFLVTLPVAMLAAVLVARFLPDDGASRPSARREIMWSPAIVASLLASSLVAAVLMATLVVGPFYLARTLQLDAGLVGGAMTVGPVVAALCGPVAGRAVDRFGAGPATVAALAAIGLGTAVLASLPAALGVAGYVTPLAVVTGGYALFQTANNTAVVGAVARERAGAASGWLNLARNLGLIAGAAGMGAVFSVSAGSADVASASPEAVATGTRATFAVAVGLVTLAFALVRPRAPAARHRHRTTSG